MTLANPKMTKQWFTFAIRDLKASRALVDFSQEFKYAAVYHSQQCAEKAIKGFLTAKNVRVPKTHDLEELAKMVRNLDTVLSSLIIKNKELTGFAISYRYPDAVQKRLTFAKAKWALRQARKIYDSCYKKVYGK